MRTLASTLVVIALALFAARPAHAQSNPGSRGFTLQRYEPTAAGQWSFWVDHPRFEREITFAGMLSFDYALRPLVVRLQSQAAGAVERSIIRQQLYAHVDLSLSLLARLELSLSLPALLYEQGSAAVGIELGGFAVGDPRAGAMLKLYGDPTRDPFAISAGAQLWIPIGGNDEHVGDRITRVAPRVSLAGVHEHLLWSALFQFLYRDKESIGQLPSGGTGNTVGSELQLGAAIAYADFRRHFSIGPEAVFATVISDSHAFQARSSRLEVLLGAHYRLHDQVLFSLAGGLGALHAPGSPDARMIFRVGYAPEKHAPPPQPALPAALPEPDRDGDAISDRLDACPDEPAGLEPDRQRAGCPRRDRDHDSLFDDEDACPDVPGVQTTDPKTRGCPLPDRDNDGVLDDADQCPDLAQGPRPDPARSGCPVADRDADDVPDDRDQCPDLPAGSQPHPSKPGCPTVKDDKIVLDPIFFKSNSDVLLPESTPALQSLADIMASNPSFEKVSIEGHTDSRGSRDKNQQLSAKRAQSVLRWLAAHGVASSRLSAIGWGVTRPIASNDSEEGRSSNRRVEFVIVKGQPAAPP